jgi:hypothetical protein
MTTEHSPLPWRILYEKNGLIGEADGAPIGHIGSDLLNIKGRDEANAEYIVRACNAFPELVALLEETVHRLGEIYDSHRETEGKGCLCAYCDRHRRLTDLLARTRGES